MPLLVVIFRGYLLYWVGAQSIEIAFFFCEDFNSYSFHFMVAADLITKGIEGAIKKKTVTYDLHRQMKGEKKVSCSEFGKAVINNM